MTKMKMNDYLSILGCELANSDRLYDSWFITYVRVAAVSGSFFVRAQCCAEMRKGVSYVVDIKIANTGCILETQCQCAAGIGPSAHCKHVRSSFFCFTEFTVNGKLHLKLTCTQKLQTFHRAKPHLGSPLKAEHLK